MEAPLLDQRKVASKEVKLETPALPPALEVWSSKRWRSSALVRELTPVASCSMELDLSVTDSGDRCVGSVTVVTAHYTIYDCRASETAHHGAFD